MRVGRSSSGARPRNERHRVVRLVRVVRGRIVFSIECQPRFDYGRKSHKTEILSDGWKPSTGSIWLDALVFAGILLGMAFVIWWAMWYL